MNILGINAYHGDASVALVRDGELVGAIEEERLNRRKHCAGFPSMAAKAVLAEAGVTPQEIDHVAVSRDPKANLHKKILFAIQKRPSFTKLVKDRLANVAKVRGVDDALAAALGVVPSALRAKVHAVEHHKSHISSAFFVSPFDQAACLSIDGFGDFVSTMRGVGRDRSLEIIDRVEFPHSAGLFYTAVTQFLGFHRYGEEWKMMGLAPYGKPTHVAELRRMIHPVDGGHFELNLDYFRHHTDGVEMTWDDGSPHIGLVFSPKIAELLGPPRDPEDPEFFGKWADIAHSAQVVYEEIFFHVLEDLQRRTGLTQLALAGGCALNSVANGKIFERTKFRDVFIQPGAGDDGTAIGAAFYVEHAVLKRPRRFVMRNAYTSMAFDDPSIEAAIGRARSNGWDASIAVRRLDDAELYRQVAKAAADGKVVGWFQGRMEFGPRALGNRSIVADPRRADMKDILNKRIKHRETYRPFAPSVLEEKAPEIFERSEPSPFMLLVYKVREGQRASIPAVTHVDNTGRLQTVSAATNPRYHALISEFERQTGVPLMLNTSFNEHEPIVASPTTPSPATSRPAWTCWRWATGCWNGRSKRRPERTSGEGVAMRTASIAFIIAVLVGTALTPIVRRLARRFGVLDHARSSRKIHGQPIPRLGGIAIVIAFYAPMVALLFFHTTGVGAMFVAEREHVLGLFLGGAIIAALGLYDDLRGANAAKKFLVQFGVAALLFKLGFRFDVLANPFGEPIALGWASLPITMLWVVGVINAMNLIDGLDGLAGGVALVAVITTFLVSLQRGHPLMMLFSSALAGAIVGFLFYNWNPASIFMGDTGSMFLGFVLAATAMQTNQKASTAVAVLIPAIALGLPIMDTLLAIGRRALRGRPLFQADREHIHHKLLDRGLSHRQAVLLLYGFCILLGGAALILTYASSGQSAALLVVLALLAYIFLRSLGYVRLDRMPESTASRKRNRAIRATIQPLGRRLRQLRGPTEMWPLVLEAARALGAAAATLRVDVPEMPETTTPLTLSHTPDDGTTTPTYAPFSFRFTVPSAKAAERTLELVWFDGRSEIDRDTEIAAEIFCEHLGEALDLARAGTSPSASAPRPLPRV